MCEARGQRRVHVCVCFPSLSTESQSSPRVQSPSCLQTGEVWNSVKFIRLPFSLEALIDSSHLKNPSQVPLVWRLAAGRGECVTAAGWESERTRQAPRLILVEEPVSCAAACPREYGRQFKSSNFPPMLWWQLVNRGMKKRRGLGKWGLLIRRVRVTYNLQVRRQCRT